MRVDWKWLARMGRAWSGRSRDFPTAEQRAYRASLGLPQTPPHVRKLPGESAAAYARRRWNR